jgi:hypothetical protein
MAARTTVLPVNMALSIGSGGTFPSAPSTGIDAAGVGTTFATAWAGAATGIQFVNTGNVWIWYYNGATACTAYLLVGQKAGGDVITYTTESLTLNTSGYGFIPPMSPSKYNQTDSTQFTSAPGGVIGTAAVGLTCVDFSATGTLAVRLLGAYPVT